MCDSDLPLEAEALVHGELILRDVTGQALAADHLSRRRF
jgi:hypothetical protein